MHVILTHEQADFDALASLLGASLIEEQAVAVLPLRMNRNVRAYITLYGLELPFIERRELARQPIESVTLVDTQSLVSLRGMEEDTQIYVIDHHERRDDLPESWRVTTDGTGANSTLLVEMIQGRDLALTVPQATLLLLGIYEDTGGLTYTRTTARDARAVAFLLECGASLTVAQEFLNHPLSPAQQKIYDALRDNAVVHPIAGFDVMIAYADATELEEELSTVVHKLRDLLDPDGLITVIETGGGVQLISRAMVEQVDVAGLMATFGGGGHRRAAAALVRDKSVADVMDEVIVALPNFVQPAVTVGEIMSRTPHTLLPDTPIEEADVQMRLYGYEGYPVVGGAGVVGLLTRRAVDRALSHGLNVLTESVMEAGAHTVTADDAVDVLRQLMTESGWGQIPVVEANGGAVVGIVTRTDLIKTLTPQTAPDQRLNLASKLESALPPARLVLLKAAAEEVQTQQMSLYIVGGFVRDLILEHPSLDVDLVVEGDGIALGQALATRFGGKVHTHERFGTAKWTIDGIREALAEKLSAEYGLKINPADFPASLDLVSARREFYLHPTALPTVERGSIKLDLHRRDFPINTLALRLDGPHYGELHDYWGGLDDLEAGRIRVLHSLSFVDDPTRILRAVRYEQRYGFEIEKRTLDLMTDALPLLGRVSGDRLRHELTSILREGSWEAMLTRLKELQVLPAIDAGLEWNDAIRTKFTEVKAVRLASFWDVDEVLNKSEGDVTLIYVVWLLGSSNLQSATTAGRLNLSMAVLKAVLMAHRMNDEIKGLAGQSPSAITAVLGKLPLIGVLGLWLLSDDEELRAAYYQYAKEWRKIQPVTTGHDLRNLKIKPGPLYRRILDGLRAAWLDGDVTSVAEERELLDKMLVDEGVGG